MNFIYAARDEYNESSQDVHMSWKAYIEWSKLTHLIELVSLDGMLNEDLVEVDRNSEEFWNNIVIRDMYETGFYSDLNFVLNNIQKKEGFNLLAVVIEPERDCTLVHLSEYDFLGYELLDKDFGISALSNCGGFDETFVPTDLNKFGLVSDFAKAIDIRNRLYENNPEEHHADTNLIAVCRNQFIGRKL